MANPSKLIFDDLEFKDDLQGRVADIELCNLHQPVELCISLDATLPQERLERMILEEFVIAWPEIERPLRQAVFAYYRATSNNCEDAGPVVPSAEQVWSFAKLYSVQVPEIVPDGRYVQLVGSCTWEEEHGLEVCVKNGTEIVYVGSFTGNSHRASCRDKSWNYARHTAG